MDFLNEFILCFHSLSNEQTKTLVWWLLSDYPNYSYEKMAFDEKRNSVKTERVCRIVNVQRNCLPNYYAKREKNCIWFSKMSGFLEYFRQSRYVYSRWTKKKLKCNATKLIFPHIYPSLKESRAHLLVTKSIAMMKTSSLAICQILKQYLWIFSEV